MYNQIDEFIRRSKTKYKKEQIEQALRDNFSIVSDDGFICFSITQDECFILFSYVKPGGNSKAFLMAVEMFAKLHGCTSINFVTQRDKAFQRLYKDFKPAGVLFTKELR